MEVIPNFSLVKGFYKERTIARNGVIPPSDLSDQILWFTYLCLRQCNYTATTVVVVLQYYTLLRYFQNHWHNTKFELKFTIIILHLWYQKNIITRPIYRGLQKSCHRTPIFAKPRLPRCNRMRWHKINYSIVLMYTILYGRTIAFYKLTANFQSTLAMGLQVLLTALWPRERRSFLQHCRDHYKPCQHLNCYTAFPEYHTAGCILHGKHELH